MVKNSRKWWILAVIAVFAVLIVQDMWRRPGPEDLPGGFKEIAFVRNEQNKGGILRIYAFSVADPAVADYLACGALLPHNDYGSVTKAYFFRDGDPVPTMLQVDQPHFDTLRFQPVAQYIRGEDGVGRVFGY